MKESWKPVLDWVGFYEVSNLGRVRSLPRRVKNRHGTRLVPGKILSPGRSGPKRNQYLMVGLHDSVGGRKKLKKVHILMLEAFVGPCPEDMEARHLNGDNFKNRLSNLQWGTPKENGEDRVRHGTARSGTSLEDEKVAAIYRAGGSWAELADRFGISSAAVSRIKGRRSYRHLPLGPPVPPRPQSLTGEENPNSRLTVERVRRIKKTEGTAQSVAARFSVSKSTILRIRKGEAWAHVV